MDIVVLRMILTFSTDHHIGIWCWMGHAVNFESCHYLSFGTTSRGRVRIIHLFISWIMTNWADLVKSRKCCSSHKRYYSTS
jgi:hypothetical protein